jgi:hypothetical protein
MERVWFVFGNGQGGYTVAKQATGGFMYHMAGPLTWDEAVVWMRQHGVPGW